MKIKRIVVSVIFLHVLIFMLAITNLIPREIVYDNLSKSIFEYMSDGHTQYVENNALTIDDASADSTELQIMYHNDPSKLLYSVIVTPAYRDFSNQDFIRMSYDSIINNKEPNYDYNRYWHGYQILWKPLLTFCQVNTIKLVYLIGYIILFIYLVFLLLKDINTRVFGIGYILMHIFCIIPFGFISLEYIPVFFIMTIGCLLLYQHRIDTAIIFYCLGISAAFFDFWTAETLTVSVPLILFTIVRNPKYKDTILNGIRWIIGYCGTFLYKWILASVLVRENYIIRAVEKYNTHEGKLGKFYGLKINVGRLFNFKFTLNNSLYIFIAVMISIYLIYYIFRKVDSNTNFILSISSICLIPYLEYIICNGHSGGYSKFTYRSQLVIFILITIIINEIDMKLLCKSKKYHERKA